MEQSNGRETLFLSTFYELRRHYEDKHFRFKRVIDDKNVRLLLYLQENSYELNEKVQKEIDALVSLEYKAHIAKATTDVLKALVNSADEFENLPDKGPQVLQIAIWLLTKDEDPLFHDQFKIAIDKIYGNETLQRLESLNHIKVDELEKMFKIELKPENVKDYLASVESLYLPVEGLAPPEEPEDEGEMTKEVKAISDYNKIMLKNQRYFASTGLIPLKKNPYKSLAERLVSHTISKITKISPLPETVGKVKVLNRTRLFSLSIEGDILKFPTQKGERKDVISFHKQLEAHFKASNQHFLDKLFPPEPASITTDFEKYPNVPQIPWKRIGEIYSKKNLTLCSDEISPNDINQGNLGNCYFLSALSVLAEHKSYIQRLFQSREISPTGCYSVWLCDSGEWKEIIVDDYFACDTVKNVLLPRFSRTKGTDIWVLLLEKAYAKLYGSYYATSAGYQGEALIALTGAPVKYFLPKRRGTNPLENIWTFIREGIQNKFVITAAGRKETEVLKHKAMGLVSGHAYGVLDAQEVQLADGKTERILKMRNPWGTVEWKGMWGDKSPVWTPDLLKALNYLPKDMDGVFWISLADFDKYFSQLCVCQTHENYKFSFMKLGDGKRQQNHFISKFKIDNPGYVYLSVQQKRNKFFQGNTNYRYSYARILLAKTDENGQIVKAIHGKYRREQCVTLRVDLEKGDYLVILEMDWIQAFYNELILSAYAPMEIDIQEEPAEKYDMEKVYSDFVRACFNSGLPNIKTVQIKLGATEYHAWKHVLGTRFGLNAMWLVNQEKDFNLYYKIMIRNLENIELILPKVEPKTVEVTVPPGEERLVLFKAKMNITASKITMMYGDVQTVRQDFPPERLKELCKERGVKSVPVKDLPITVYSFGYLGGMARYYVNETTQGSIQEVITYTSDGLLINGEDKKTIEIKVGPGEEFLLNVRGKDNFAAINFEKTSKMKYFK